MSETSLSKSIRLALNAAGFWCIRIGSLKVKKGKRMIRSGEPGVPDLAVLSPCTGWLEVKRPGEDLSDDQKTWHAKAARAGVRVAVVRSVREAVEVVSLWRRDKRAA
jgi:hypothetical protein